MRLRVAETRGNPRLNQIKTIMEKEFILYGVKDNQPDYMEEVITVQKSEDIIEKAKVWAIKNGYNRLRVYEFNWEKPDFTKTLA